MAVVPASLVPFSVALLLLQASKAGQSTAYSMCFGMGQGSAGLFTWGWPNLAHAA